MAQQTIGIGSAANDGTGDPLRTAFGKANTNFTELYGTHNDALIAALVALVTAADKGLYFTGSNAPATFDLTSFARTLLDDADAAAMRSTLGLVIGTNVQAFDAELAAIAGLTSAADKLPYFTGSGTAALADLSAAMRTFMSTPSSANLAALLSDETGSGAAVFGTSGSFTPGFSATGATFNYGSRFGYYRQVGKLVWFTLGCKLAASGNTLTSNALAVTGLPVTSSATSTVRVRVEWFGATSNFIGMGGFIGAGATSINLTGMTAAGTSSVGTVSADTALHATNQSELVISGVYEAA